MNSTTKCSISKASRRLQLTLMLRHDTQCCFHAPNKEYTNHKSGKLTVECKRTSATKFGNSSSRLTPTLHTFSQSPYTKSNTQTEKRNTNTRRTVPQLDITLKESKTE